MGHAVYKHGNVNFYSVLIKISDITDFFLYFAVKFINICSCVNKGYYNKHNFKQLPQFKLQFLQKL